MSFAGNLENLKQDIANILDVFSKQKEYIEQAELKLKTWEEELKERERKRSLRLGKRYTYSFYKLQEID